MQHPFRSHPRTTRAAAVLALAGAAGWTAFASSHREAPVTAFDHKADITDFYAFVSYEDATPGGAPPEDVTLILCVDPLLEPANGPTLFPFDPDILYEIHVDNDHDALPDKSFQFRFDLSFGLPDVPVAVAGVPGGASDPVTGATVVPPRITSLTDPGLNLRQTYTVDVVDVATGQVSPIVDPAGAPFRAVPGNAGDRTMDYAALYGEGTYSLPSGVSLFAGTVDDPFFIDLGAAFDTLNFRTLRSGVPGVLTPFEDEQVSSNLATDTLSGYAVNAIAIEVPIEMLTSTGQVEPPSSPDAVVGAWATTSRQQMTVRRSPDEPLHSGPWVQVQRFGNPLINELVIGIGHKDRFSRDVPANDAQFAGFFLDPPIVQVAEALYGGALAVPDAPRNDLLPLVQYAPPIAPAGTPAGPIADLMRLNTGVPAVPDAMQSRLGFLGGDTSGFPNGRRPKDDVVDVVLRVAVGGVLAAPFPGYTPGVNDRLGDGTMASDPPPPGAFPYLGHCPSGRDRRHKDPGEPGGGVR